MARIEIHFTPPNPAPPEYVVKYREVGTTVYTTLSPNPTASPAVITNLPDGKEWEGTIQSACSPTLLSSPQHWSVVDEGLDMVFGITIREVDLGNGNKEIYVRMTRSTHSGIELQDSLTVSGNVSTSSGGVEGVDAIYSNTITGFDLVEDSFVGVFPTSTTATVQTREPSLSAVLGTNGVTYNVVLF